MRSFVQVTENGIVSGSPDQSKSAPGLSDAVLPYTPIDENLQQEQRKRKQSSKRKFEQRRKCNEPTVRLSEKFLKEVAELQRKVAGKLNERTTTGQSCKEHTPPKRSKERAAVGEVFLLRVPIISSTTEQMLRRDEDVIVIQPERIEEESSQASTSEEFLAVSAQIRKLPRMDRAFVRNRGRDIVAVADASQKVPSGNGPKFAGYKDNSGSARSSPSATPTHKRVDEDDPMESVKKLSYKAYKKIQKQKMDEARTLSRVTSNPSPDHRTTSISHSQADAISAYHQDPFQLLPIPNLNQDGQSLPQQVPATATGSGPTSLQNRFEADIFDSQPTFVQPVPVDFAADSAFSPRNRDDFDFQDLSTPVQNVLRPITTSLVLPTISFPVAVSHQQPESLVYGSELTNPLGDPEEIGAESNELAWEQELEDYFGL